MTCTVQYSTVLYNTVQYRAVQYSIVQCFLLCAVHVCPVVYSAYGSTCEQVYVHPACANNIIQLHFVCTNTFCTPNTTVHTQYMNTNKYNHTTQWGMKTELSGPAFRMGKGGICIPPWEQSAPLGNPESPL